MTGRITGTGAGAFVPASSGGERRVRALVRLARYAVSFGLRYRLRELQLLAIPCCVALIGAVRRPIDPFSDWRVSMVIGVAFCLLLLAANVLLTLTTPWADQHLWPVAALMLALQFALSPAVPGGGPAALMSVGLAAVLIVGTARAARPAVQWLVGRGVVPARRWMVAVALLCAAAGALLVALWSDDLGWGYVVLASLLAPIYVWSGGGTACLVVAGTAVAGGWALVPWLDRASALASLEQAQRPWSGVTLAAIDDLLALPGLAAVIALCAAMCARGLRAALLQRDARSHVVAALVAALAAQAFVAVASNQRLLWPSRVPVPFLGDHPLETVLPAILLGLLLRLSNDAGGGERSPSSPDVAAG